MRVSPRLRAHFRIINLTAAAIYVSGPKKIEGRLTYLKLEYVGTYVYWNVHHLDS